MNKIDILMIGSKSQQLSSLDCVILLIIDLTRFTIKIIKIITRTFIKL